MTPKQEAFCQAIADGKNQSDAYRLAYNAANMKADTVNNKAYELMQNGDITARIQELRDKLEAVALWTREAYLQHLVDNIELAKRQDKPQCAAINTSLSLIGKCLGYDAPIKHDVTISKNIADLSDEELQAICDGFIDREIEERQRG